jgi:hypothetical protein
MNKDEALKPFDEILVACEDLTEKDLKLVLPGSGEVESHGYQLNIRSKSVKANLQCIRKIVEKNNLAIADKSQMDLVIIYRQCFFHYSGGNLSTIKIA